jgi:hypothetical protein
MVILNEGLNRIRDLIDTDITKGTLGTSGTAAAVTDTDLIAKDVSTEFTVTKQVSDKQIQFDYGLNSTSGTSTTYREFKLHNASYDYDRIVFTGIAWTKNGSEEISITKKYFIKGT